MLHLQSSVHRIEFCLLQHIPHQFFNYFVGTFCYLISAQSVAKKISGREVMKSKQGEFDFLFVLF